MEKGGGLSQGLGRCPSVCVCSAPASTVSGLPDPMQHWKQEARKGTLETTQTALLSPSSQAPDGWHLA